MKLRTRVLTGLLWTLAAGAWAQEPGGTALSPVVGIGNRVRLESSAVRGHMQGLVVGLDDEVLTLAADNGVPIKVPARSITSLEVSLGRRRHALEGLGIGLAGGLLFGLVAPVDKWDCGDRSPNFCSRGQAIGGSTFGFGLIGAGVGALIRTDRWGVVPLHAPGPQAQDGFSGGLAIAFRF